MTAGRPRNNEPATAYDVRRYLTLVQVLAQSESEESIRVLCVLWGMEPVWDLTVTCRGKPCMNILATLRKLAQHVVAYHREHDE